MSEAREESIAAWERAATGWSKRAASFQQFAMPVSTWLIDRLRLQPGYRVLELAAGPGETGFLAAELIRPGGTLICSDASDAMLEVARQRAAELGLDNVEFRHLELEWIDMPTASVDAILCRWGMMLSADAAASLQETRRVLRPGGRIALAVWDEADHNPWATITTGTLVKLGHAERPEPGAPGMFVLAPAQRLRELLETAGYLDVVVEAIQLERLFEGVRGYIEETHDLSPTFGGLFERLNDAQRAELIDEITALAVPYQGGDGSLRIPGRALVAAASA
jgi:SAM-dependent methyltransferase